MLKVRVVSYSMTAGVSRIKWVHVVSMFIWSDINFPLKRGKEGHYVVFLIQQDKGVDQKNRTLNRYP